MKIYRTYGESKFETEIVEPSERSDLIKVRVTHVLPSKSDVSIFSGESSIRYPFVIGHSAIGVISDDRPEYGLKRGTKVILNPYSEGELSRLDSEPFVSTLGLNEDGFMREYVYMEKEKIVAFPEDVDEEEAIFTECIAIALKVLNSFTLEKGDYIAIVGGDVISNLIAQLAMYFQLVPIVIDSNESNLAHAEKCGVYYTINETKESPISRVKEITCDRMVEETVVDLSDSTSPAFVFSLSRESGKCVILSENKVVKVFDADVSMICKRQLRIRGINNGDSEFDSAINILAQKIINFDGFIDKVVEMKDAEIVLRELKNNPDRYFNVVIKL